MEERLPPVHPGEVLLEDFNEGVIHTINKAENIYKSIKLGIEKKDSLREEIKNLKAKRNQEWRRQWKALLDKINLKQ